VLYSSMVSPFLSHHLPQLLLRHHPDLGQAQLNAALLGPSHGTVSHAVDALFFFAAVSPPVFHVVCHRLPLRKNIPRPRSTHALVLTGGREVHCTFVVCKKWGPCDPQRRFEASLGRPYTVPACGAELRGKKSRPGRSTRPGRGGQYGIAREDCLYHALSNQLSPMLFSLRQISWQVQEPWLCSVTRSCRHSPAGTCTQGV